MDDATYERRKAAALAIATKRLKAVNAIRDSRSSDTEDIEGEAAALLGDYNAHISSDDECDAIPRGLVIWSTRLERGWCTQWIGR